MAPPIILEEVFSDRVVEIGRLTGAESMVLGREPEYGIKIPNSTAASREHGVFIPYGEHWLYKDLSSTNGSSHGGYVLAPETPAVVRPGEIVEMAGHLIRLSLDTEASSHPPQSDPSLLVFHRSEVRKEIFLKDASGVFLVIGGKSADLKLEIDIEEHPSLIFERRGQAIVAYSVAKSGDPRLNGSPIAAPMTLKDRDELTVGHYRCLYLDELSRSLSTTTKVAMWEDKETAAFRNPTGRYRARRSFGQLPNDQGTPKSEVFMARRVIDSAKLDQPKAHSSASTGVILILIFIFCGGLGLLVSFLL